MYFDTTYVTRDTTVCVWCSLSQSDPELSEYVVQPTFKAGDVLVFTEAALHGTLPWTSEEQRRSVIYRFAPAGSAYGRGFSPEWPAKTLEGMTPGQRAVMQPPFHPRMNRVCVDEAGEAVEPKPRESFKVEFDEKVFGSRYF